MVPLLVALLLPLAGSQAPHPLEPLTAAEINRVGVAIRADARWTRSTQVAEMRLVEPPKAAVLAWRPGSIVPRRVLAILTDPPANRTAEVTIDPASGAIAEWRAVPGAQTWITRWSTDDSVAGAILQRDDRWRAALAERKATPADVIAFAGPAEGYFPFERDGNRRAVAFAVAKGEGRDGRFDGLSALVDLTRGIVERVDDRGGVDRTIRRAEDDSLARLKPTGVPPKPLRILQPAGPSYRVSGHSVSWQGWEFRFGFEARSGLVLYQVARRDGESLRPVLYRASVSEMAVPYGDPGWRIWMPLDVGFVGLGGYSKTSLGVGADVPENSRFFESVVHDGQGRAVIVPRAVALFERDGGVLWRHGPASRRSRELVLAFFATVDNYDYGFQWVFRQDGTLATEVLLTGQMNTRMVAEARAVDHGKGTAYGTLVAPYVFAPNHQHFFSFRLDLDVDGASPNRVVEMNPIGAIGPRDRPDPMGHQETVFAQELDARRLVNPLGHRLWRVVNPGRHNRLGQPTSYALVPGDNAVPLVPEGGFIRDRVGFVNYHLWVTPENDAELYAAGDYAYLGHHGDGLPTWTRANRSIEDRDLVLWYTLGVTHVPRPEDWPVMPVVKTGFQLVPVSFFDENPALGVPARY